MSRRNRFVDSIVGIGTILAVSSAALIFQDTATPPSDAYLVLLFSASMVTIHLRYHDVIYERFQAFLAPSIAIGGFFFISLIIGYIGLTYAIVTDAEVYAQIQGMSGVGLKNTSITLSTTELLQNNITIGIFSAFIPIVFIGFVFFTGYSVGNLLATFQGANVVDFVFASVIAHGLLELFALFNLSAIGLYYTVRTHTVVRKIDVEHKNEHLVRRNLLVLLELYRTPSGVLRRNVIYTSFLISILATAAVIEANLSLFIADVYMDQVY